MKWSADRGEAPYEIVVARLFLSSPHLRSVAIATASDSDGVEDVCGHVANAMEAAGHKVRVVQVKTGGPGNRPGTSAQTQPVATPDEIGPELLASPEKFKAEVGSFDGVTMVCGRGLLQSGPSLTAAAHADGVLLVVERGRTYRSDLERAANIVRSSGGTVLGAILCG